ncbi:DUF5082 family protein [Bacillus sp. FSL W7-1360]
MPYTMQIRQLKNTVGALQGTITTGQEELKRLAAARKSLVSHKSKLSTQKSFIMKQPIMSGEMTRGKATARHTFFRNNMIRKNQLLVLRVQSMINAIDKQTSSISSDISRARTGISSARSRMSILETRQKNIEEG